MKMSLTESVVECQSWFNKLNEQEKSKALDQMFRQLLYSEDIRVDDNGKPYWTSCGIAIGDSE